MTGTAADIEAVYERRLADRREELATHERSHARFGFLRLAIAVAAVVLLLIGGLQALSWLLVPLACFVLVAWLHARQLNARDRTVSAIAFYERGLDRIRHKWIGKGRTGDVWRPAEHLYADDLDVFGRGSLFELLATTRTKAGEETLARWLLNPAPNAEARARQNAVRELSTLLDLRERVAVTGDHVKIAVDAPLLRAWATHTAPIGGRSLRLCVAVLVTLTVGAMGWWASTGTLGTLAALLAIAELAVGQWLRPRVAAVIAAVDEPAHELGVLARLLRIVELGQFQSEHLRALQASLRGGAPASVEIEKLSRLVALLASRRNMLFAIPSGLLMWGTQWAFAIEAWKARAGVHVPRWLDAIGEFEALLSLAGFAAEHPAFIFPELVEDGPVIDGAGLAHVTLPRDAVTNDIHLGVGAPRLLIVSGSNMSGKTTWMRTIGVNVVLARMGAPVRATHLRLSPLAIGAAIRVLDSLTDGRSRFYAEVVRLKQILGLTRQHRGEVLFLLDEILSGTNSHDRRIGAEAVMAGLVREGAVGLVTTHDLALAGITNRLEGLAENAHFDDRFSEGTLQFDYKLKPGVVETSNALALMRAVGIEL